MTGDQQFDRMAELGNEALALARELQNYSERLEARVAELEGAIAAFEQLRAAAEAVQVTIRHVDTSEVDGDGAKKLLATALAALPPASDNDRAANATKGAE